MLKNIQRLLFTIGLVFIIVFCVKLYNSKKLELQHINEANKKIEEYEKKDISIKDIAKEFQANTNEAFGILEIPKLNRVLPIIEGTNEDALGRGAGHHPETFYPGEGDQILLAGHRNTVFKDFGNLEIGDEFIVHMPYGDFTYEIKETKIVDGEDTSVIKKMDEEVLLVSTCYPFRYLSTTSERFVAYAYPVD